MGCSTAAGAVSAAGAVQPYGKMTAREVSGGSTLRSALAAGYAGQTYDTTQKLHGADLPTP